MTYQECYAKFVKAQKQLDKACNRYARNSTEENFEKALEAEQKVNLIEDELKALSNA